MKGFKHFRRISQLVSCWRMVSTNNVHLRNNIKNNTWQTMIIYSNHAYLEVRNRQYRQLLVDFLPSMGLKLNVFAYIGEVEHPTQPTEQTSPAEILQHCGGADIMNFLMTTAPKIHNNVPTSSPKETAENAHSLLQQICQENIIIDAE